MNAFGLSVYFGMRKRNVRPSLAWTYAMAAHLHAESKA